MRTVIVFFSMSKIVELRTKRNTMWEQTKSFLEEHRDENGLVAAEFVDQYDRMADEVAQLGAEIARLEQQAEIDAMLSQPTSTPVKTKQVPDHHNRWHSKGHLLHGLRGGLH